MFLRHFTLELKGVEGRVRRTAADETWIKPARFSGIGAAEFNEKVAVHAQGSNSLNPARSLKMG